jgi:hypothetical protein
MKYEEGEKKTKEEKELIEKLQKCKRKRKEDGEEEINIAKELFRVQEKGREATREVQLKRRKSIWRSK